MATVEIGPWNSTPSAEEALTEPPKFESDNPEVTALMEQLIEARAAKALYTRRDTSLWKNANLFKPGASGDPTSLQRLSEDQVYLHRRHNEIIARLRELKVDGGHINAYVDFRLHLAGIRPDNDEGIDLYDRTTRDTKAVARVEVVVARFREVPEAKQEKLKAVLEALGSLAISKQLAQAFGVPPWRPDVIKFDSENPELLGIVVDEFSSVEGEVEEDDFVVSFCDGRAMLEAHEPGNYGDDKARASIDTARAENIIKAMERFHRFLAELDVATIEI